MKYKLRYTYDIVAAVITRSMAVGRCVHSKITSSTVRQWLEYGVAALALIMMTVMVYWVSMRYPFEFDDLPNIVKYFQVRHETLRTLWCSSSRWVSHWLNACYYAYSPEYDKFCPFLYRLGNLFFHCCTGLFVFISVLLISKITHAQAILQRHALFVAVLATGVFLLHPVQTQTVSYVVQGQLEGVVCWCIMALVCSFLAYNIVTSLFMKVVWVLAMACIVTLGCGVKEIFIIAPVLLFLVDYFFVAEGDLRRMRSRWWLHGSIIACVVGWYLYYLKPQFFMNVFGLRCIVPNNIGNVLTERRDQLITPWLFFISQGKVILHYAGLFVWPFFMSVDYDWKLCTSWLNKDCILPYGFLGLLAVYFLYRLSIQRTDLISFCGIWFFVSLLPRASFIPASELIADYKTYIGSYGISLLMAYGLALLYDVFEKYGGVLPRYFSRSAYAACILCMCGAAAYQRNRVWETPLAFWHHIIEAAPQRARGYNNYGTALCDAERYAEAVRYFQYAISLDAHYPDPWTNLSVAYIALKKVDESIGAARRALAIAPRHVECHNNLSSLLFMKGQLDEAEHHAREALRLRPYYGKAYVNLGKIALMRGKTAEAWELFRKGCMEGDFDTVLGFTLYGDTSFSLKKFDHAIIAYTRLLKLDHRTTEVPAVRRVYAAGYLKRYAEAEQWAVEWLHEHPRSEHMVVAYADILYEQQKYQEAARQYQKAIEAAGQKTSHALSRKARCDELMQMLETERKRAL